MRKGMPLVLTVLLLFNTLGFLYLFNYNRYLIRKEVKSIIKNSVPGNELTLIMDCISTSADDIHWVNKKEFWKNKQLFDVVRKEKHADTIYYYCIRDTQEEQLFEHLSEYVSNIINGDNSFKTKHQLIIKQTISNFFYQKQNGFNYHLPITGRLLNQIPKIPIAIILTAEPPPKTVSLI